MSTAPRRTFVFDLGNVLIRWDPRNLYRKCFGGDDARMEWFLANICNAPWNEQLDAGRPFADGIAELVAKHPTHTDHIHMWRDRWEEMLGGVISENVAVLEELKTDGHRVYALTNWSSETFVVARRLFPFLARFDGIVVSGDERLIKPDPAFFQVLFNRYALRPQDAVFIDDMSRNIDAARALGMSTIHYSADCDLRAQVDALFFPSTR